MRKHVLRSLLALLLAACLLHSAVAFAETARVTGSEVNVRSGPGMEYAILGSFVRGNSVEVIDRSNSAWYAVNYYGQLGYMSSQYLSIQASSTAEIIYPGSSSVAVAVTMPTPTPTPTYNAGGSTLVVTDWNNAGLVVAPTPSPAPSEQPVLVFETTTVGVAVTPTPRPTVQPTPTPTPAPAQSPAPVVSGGSPGSIAGDYVRFRRGPGTEYPIITSYDRGKALTILGTEGSWTACSIDGELGYVFSQYVLAASPAQSSGQAVLDNGSAVQTGGQTVLDSSGTLIVSSPQPSAAPTPEPSAAPVDTSVSSAGTSAYIRGNNVRLRSGPGLSYSIITELFYGNAVTVVGVSGDWTAVVYKGEQGFVYSQYIVAGTAQKTSVGGTATGREIADYALGFLGTNYAWGGKDPSTGFDCSGLVYYVYQHFGYTLNRVASEQAKNGRHIESTELQPGDLLCFYSGGSYIGHVGIYIGNNMFVHAASSTAGVITSELTGYYATRGFEARRII